MGGTGGQLCGSRPVLQTRMTQGKELTVNYKVFFTPRDDEDLDFKADLFTEADKPEGAQFVEFSADTDAAAKVEVLNRIVPNDRRPVRGVGKIRECRPRGKTSNLKSPVVLDLADFKDPLKAKIHDALYPLVKSGDLTEEEEGKYRAPSRDLLNIKPRKKKEETAGGDLDAAPQDGKTIPLQPDDTPQEPLPKAATA